MMINGYNVCEYCNKKIKLEETHNINGEQVCESCYEKFCVIIQPIND